MNSSAVIRLFDSLKAIAILCCSVAWSSSFTIADDEPVADDSPLRKARVQFLKDAVKRFDVAVGAEAVESKLNPNSVLVWNNPVSGTKVGILAVFARTGRPDMMAQFSFTSPQSVVNEFHNLCA